MKKQTSGSFRLQLCSLGEEKLRWGARGVSQNTNQLKMNDKFAGGERNIKQAGAKIIVFSGLLILGVLLSLDRQDYVHAQIQKISPLVFDADPFKEKKKPKEGESIMEEAPADILSLLELRRI